MTRPARVACIAVVLGCAIAALVHGAHSHLGHAVVFAAIGGAAATRFVAHT